jgi:hypothetical protein
MRAALRYVRTQMPVSRPRATGLRVRRIGCAALQALTACLAWPLAALAQPDAAATQRLHVVEPGRGPACPSAQQIAEQVALLEQPAAPGAAPSPALLIELARLDGVTTARIRLDGTALDRTLEFAHADCEQAAQSVALAGVIMREEALKRPVLEAPVATLPAPPMTVWQPGCGGACAEQQIRAASIAADAPAVDRAQAPSASGTTAWLALVGAPTTDLFGGMGGAAALRLELSWDRLLLAGGAFSTVPATHQFEDVTLETWIAGVDVTGCGRLASWTSIGVSACGSLALARLRAVAIPNPETALLWSALGGAFRLDGALWTGLGWQLAAALILPLRREVFVVETLRAESAAVAFRAELGLRWALD